MSPPAPREQHIAMCKVSGQGCSRHRAAALRPSLHGSLGVSTGDAGSRPCGWGSTHSRDCRRSDGKAPRVQTERQIYSRRLRTAERPCFRSNNTRRAAGRPWGSTCPGSGPVNRDTTCSNSRPKVALGPRLRAAWAVKWSRPLPPGRTDLVIASRQIDNCEQVAVKSGRSGPGVGRVYRRMRQVPECDALLEAAYGEFGRIEILITNDGHVAAYPGSH